MVPGGPADTYVSGVEAVLVATLAPAGEAPPADCIDRLLAMLGLVVRDAGGEAERMAPDGIVAGFPAVASSVAAALEIQRRLALSDTGEARIEGRVGVLALGTVISPDGEALAAAMATARRLAAAARPGTLVLSERALDVLPSELAATVERIDLGDLRAHLLVPPPMGPPLARRTVLSGIAGAAALGAVGAAVALSLRRGDSLGGAQRIALGVLRFKAAGVADADLWIRDAVRDGLNTQLSELAGVRVYSREFLDFLMTRQGLSEIEVATKLGIEKMLAGGVSVVDGVVRVDTQIVDVASGVIDSSFTRSGTRADFLALQNEVIVGVIDKLGLRLTSEDERRLAARRATDVDALRHLLEVEGGKPVPVPPHPTTNPPAPNTSWFGPASAWADDDEVVRRDITAFLEGYRRATEAGDIAALAPMYADFSAEQRSALVRYFAGVRSLRVAIDNVEIAVVGDEAVTSYSRIDDFVDAKTGRPLHVAVSVTKTLTRARGGWVFAATR